MNLGSRIREARLQKQMTQKDVVGDFMTRNMLSKIENGSATPSVKTLTYLSEALGLPVSYFVGESEYFEDTPHASAQLEEIEKLAESLAGDGRGDIRAVSLCIRARVLLITRNADAALALLESADIESLGANGARLALKTMEDCCTIAGDYKRAYDIAVRRIETV